MTHNHTPNFGRIVHGCARCTELKLGAAPRQWNKYRSIDAQRSAEIRSHNCATSRCAVVCTFGDW